MTNSTGSTQIHSENFYDGLELSEIDLLEKCLYVYSYLEVVPHDDIFWLTLGTRLSITLQKRSPNERSK
jgi:hypothetical protein